MGHRIGLGLPKQIAPAFPCGPVLRLRFLTARRHRANARKVIPRGRQPATRRVLQNRRVSVVIHDPNGPLYPTEQQYLTQHLRQVYPRRPSGAFAVVRSVYRAEEMTLIHLDGTAPYAPTKTVITVLERHRQVGLPTITVDTLQRMGITGSLAPRTVQALKLLDLLDEHGKSTEQFEVLRKAPSDAVGTELALLLRKVYGPVFEVVDPTTATVPQIEDAFRHFTPSGQRSRMVTLFTGLMAYAGMIKVPPKQKPGPRAGTTPSRRGPEQKPPPVKPPQQPPPPPPPEERSVDGDMYQIALRSGGMVTVFVNVNLFRLSSADREFVLGIVDALTGYSPSVDAKVPGEGGAS